MATAQPPWLLALQPHQGVGFGWGAKSCGPRSPEGLSCPTSAVAPVPGASRETPAHAGGTEGVGMEDGLLLSSFPRGSPGVRRSQGGNPWHPEGGVGG